MALTQMQARDKYIFDSMVQFISRAIKAAYDAEVASTTYVTPLQVRAGRSDDRDVVLSPPIIAVDDAGGTEKDRAFEVGTLKTWRHYNFVLYCYPALNADGTPSPGAAALLKAYVRNAFAGEFIKVLDYSNGSFSANNILYCSDGMYLTGVTDPMDRGKNAVLAQERHRFDVHVSVKVPVAEVVVT